MSAYVQRSFAGWKRPGKDGRSGRRGRAYRPTRIRIDREWLRTEYVDKMRSTTDIAEELGCGAGAILRRLREYGIPVRNRGDDKKLTANDYYVLAKDRGFEWLGSLPPNTHSKSWWRCDQGHEWKSCYSYIQQGDGCPHCAGTAPKAIKDYHSIARKHGFEWLGLELPANIKTKTLWRCGEGHKWEARYNNIYQGQGCPYCAGNAPKTIEDYHILAKRHGYKWLGLELPANVHTNTSWQCGQGHGWGTCYSSIQSGSSCSHCVGNAPKTIEDYHVLANRCGYKRLSLKLPANTRTKTPWQCDQGHKWEACYNSIKRGHGCPHCANLILYGSGNPNWCGGVSFEPYGPGFNGKLKLTIRERDSFTCQLCGVLENGRAHDCHHIDGGKDVHHHWNLITLCASEHSVVSNGPDPDTWQWKLSAHIFAKYSQGDIRWVEDI